MIIEISEKDLTVDHNLSKPTGTDKYAADTEKIERELNWRPKMTLKQGVREVYHWAETRLENGSETVEEVGQMQ